MYVQYRVQYIRIIHRCTSVSRYQLDEPGNSCAKMSSSAHEAPPTSFSSLSSLQFPIASHSLSHTTRLLHQSSQSTRNRLASIYQDATFVTHIGSSLGLPIIANERCGGWYVPPESRAGSAYFKSTDGHFGQWAFSKRRLNLQLLEIIGKNQGFDLLPTDLERVKLCV